MDNTGGFALVSCPQWIDQKKYQMHLTGILSLTPGDHGWLLDLLGGPGTGTLTAEGVWIQYPDVSPGKRYVRTVSDVNGNPVQVMQAPAAGYIFWMNGPNALGQETAAAVGSKNSFGMVVDFNVAYNNKIIDGSAGRPRNNVFPGARGRHADPDRELPGGGQVDQLLRPVRFVLTPETRAKGIFGNPVLTVEDSAEGLILDGFVFDGSTYNAYVDTGALDPGKSHLAALLDLRGGSGGITVRNCVFANAGYCAVQISAAHGTFENNVVVNSSGTAVRLQTPGAGPWTVRANTVLFAADPTGRASTGQSTTGCLLDISGRGIVLVESTVLAFADSIAVRATVPDQNLVLEGNVLACQPVRRHLRRPIRAHRAANRELTLLDEPFGGQSGIGFELPALPVDPAYAYQAVGRLSALAAAMPKDGLNAAAAALGVSIHASKAEASTEATKPSVPVKEPSVTDLLADLGRARQAFEAKDAPPSRSDAPLYCPVYPVEAALRLALEAPAGGPGAHATAVA